MVGSPVPLIPGDLCEELTWGHQAFHWPWGEGPEGWVVPQAARRLRPPPPPALAPGAAAAAESASSVSASWRRRGRERGLLFPLPGRRRGSGAPWSFREAAGAFVRFLTSPSPRRRPRCAREGPASCPAARPPLLGAARALALGPRAVAPAGRTSGPGYYGNKRHHGVTSDLPPEPVTGLPSSPALRTGGGSSSPSAGNRVPRGAPRCAAAPPRRAGRCGRAFPLRARGGSARDEGREPPTRAASWPPPRPLGAAASHVRGPPTFAPRSRRE